MTNVLNCYLDILSVSEVFDQADWVSNYVLSNYVLTLCILMGSSTCCDTINL